MYPASSVGVPLTKESGAWCAIKRSDLRFESVRVTVRGQSGRGHLISMSTALEGVSERRLERADAVNLKGVYYIKVRAKGGETKPGRRRFSAN